MNTLPVIVDNGPAAAGGTVNTLFTTVTICAPGSTGACQTIDHVQVDTGSTGFRIFASALGGALAAQLPQAQDGYGNSLDECIQFADGYIWGTVRTADLEIGAETASGIPIQVIGDAAAPAVPAPCVSGPAENTVASFGANAVLGVGNFLTDCGSACESSAIPGTYYACSMNANCVPTAIAITQQLQNPVSFFANDNNGVIITLPSATASSPGLNGTLIFGIGTQSNNSLMNAQIYTVDPNDGTFNTSYNGTLYGSSYIDAGSSGYYFTDDTIPLCSDQPAFYCPPSALPLSATIQGTNGTVAAIAFSVDNADADFSTNEPVLPNLAGPADSGMNTFDWGLPFFYGRSVYVAFEASDAAGVAGPWVGF
ncbi:MAG: DUF3443 domain-containing protein [Steroidobacteraceae bacterium]